MFPETTLDSVEIKLLNAVEPRTKYMSNIKCFNIRHAPSLFIGYLIGPVAYQISHQFF